MPGQAPLDGPQERPGPPPPYRPLSPNPWRFPGPRPSGRPGLDGPLVGGASRRHAGSQAHVGTVHWHLTPGEPWVRAAAGFPSREGEEGPALGMGGPGGGGGSPSQQISRPALESPEPAWSTGRQLSAACRWAALAGSLPLVSPPCFPFSFQAKVCCQVLPLSVPAGVGMGGWGGARRDGNACRLLQLLPRMHNPPCLFVILIFSR